jgi:hypothetical protein
MRSRLFQRNQAKNYTKLGDYQPIKSDIFVPETIPLYISLTNLCPMEAFSLFKNILNPIMTHQLHFVGQAIFSENYANTEHEN